jgi:hypothetical protein
MSVVTTQPEMLTSESSTSNGWSLAGGSHAHRSDDAGMERQSADLSGGVMAVPAIHGHLDRGMRAFWRGCVGESGRGAAPW